MRHANLFARLAKRSIPDQVVEFEVAENVAICESCGGAVEADEFGDAPELCGDCAEATDGDDDRHNDPRHWEVSLINRGM